MGSNTSGSLTATGSVDLVKQPHETLVLLQLSGTYGTVTFVVEGSLDGTNYFAIAAIRYDTGGVVNGTINPTDNAEQCWKVPSEGLYNVRARVTAIASGTAEFNLTASSFVGLPFVSVQTDSSASLGTQTFTGDVTLSGGSDLIFSGTTGQSEIILTDNLADALSVKISGGADFLVFVTTDSGEQLQCAQDLVLTGGKDLTFTGTTGQPQINLTDNLADALSVCEGANDYIVFTTTDSGEKVQIKQNLEFLDKNLVLGTTTGTKFGTATSQKLSFYNATPIVQPSAYTQTYATADKTHANPTAATLTVSDGAGTNDNTIGAITADASVIAAVQEIVDEVNKLIADVADVKQLANSVVDDLQALGLAG